MPTFEFKCECSAAIYDKLLRKWTDADPDCPVCGKQLRRLVSSPAVVWTKNVSEYGLRPQDKLTSTYNPEGIQAMRVHSTQNEDGSPQTVLLKTHKEVNQFCRAEGLIPPSDVNPNTTISKDGRSFESGAKGRWI